MRRFKLSKKSVLTALSLWMLPCLTQAQEQKNDAPADSHAVAQLNSKQFEAWVHGQEIRIQGRGEDPKPLEQAVMRRLQAESCVTDDSVMAMVKTWVFNEARGINVPAPVVPNAFTNSHRVIDAVLPLIYGRPSLAAYLYEQKALLWSMKKDKQKELESRTQASDLLNKLQIDVDRRLVYQTIELGRVAYDLGDIKKADFQYFRAFGYPWYRVDDPWGAEFRRLYVIAARGLIKSRQDDLVALKNTRFAPAILDEIGPELQAAIEAAEKKQPNKIWRLLFLGYRKSSRGFRNLLQKGSDSRRRSVRLL